MKDLNKIVDRGHTNKERVLPHSRLYGFAIYRRLAIPHWHRNFDPQDRKKHGPLSFDSWSKP